MIKRFAIVLMFLCTVQASIPQIIDSGRHRQVLNITLSDTFTGTVGTLLSSHTSNSGNTWTRDWTTSCPTTASLTGSNSAVSVTANACASYTSNWTPPSPDYTVQATCAVSSNGQCDVISRSVSGTGFSGYLVTLAGGAGVVMYLGTSGTYTQLGSVYSGVTSGTHTIAITTSGSTISAAVDGTTQISVTDTTYSAAGKAGLALFNQTANSAIISSLTAN